MPQSLCLSALAVSACSSPPAEHADVRVLTLNLLTFAVSPEVDARTQAAIDLIVAHEPDFIALQEVAETRVVENRAAVIAAATGYHYVWSATEVDAAADYHGGPAVLSRWPLAMQEVIPLPHLDFDDSVERRAIHVAAETPWGPLHLVGTHTTTSPDPVRSADQAVAGARPLLPSQNAFAGFYAGDFNAEPDSLAMQTLRGEQSHGSLAGAFDDAWLRTSGRAPGHTYPASAPARRIDYIYSTSSDSTLVQAQECELFLGEPQQDVYVSDHLALLCRFRLARRDSLDQANLARRSRMDGANAP